MVFQSNVSRNREQIGLHLWVLRHGASRELVLPVDVLPLGHTFLDLVQGGDRLRVQQLDLAAQRLEAKSLAVVDEPRQPPPRVNAVQGAGALEDGPGGARDGRREEAPERGIDDDGLLVVQLLDHGLGEDRRVDLLELARLGPLQDFLEDGGSADKVPLHFTLPSQATLGAVEAVVLLERQLLVKDGAVLEHDGAEGPLQVEREGDLFGRLWRRPADRHRLPGPPRVSAGAGVAAAVAAAGAARFKRFDLGHEVAHMDAVALAVAADDGVEYWKRYSSSASASSAGMFLGNTGRRGSLP